MQLVQWKAMSWLLFAVIVPCSVAVSASPASAASLCFSNEAGDQFVVRGIGRKIGKRKAKPVSGYVIVAAGRASPLSGSFVTDANGTSMALGLTQHEARVFEGGWALSSATTFHQLGFLMGDGKLLVGRGGTDCAWRDTSDGATSGGCVAVALIDCRTVPDLP